jgi:hypothetical protein
MWHVEIFGDIRCVFSLSLVGYLARLPAPGKAEPGMPAQAMDRHTGKTAPAMLCMARRGTPSGAVFHGVHFFKVL